MSIIYMNGFEWSSIYENMMRTSGIAFATAYPGYPYSGDTCLYLAYNSGVYIRSVEISSTSEFYAQTYFKYTAGTLSGTPQFFYWYNGATVQGTLGIDASTQTLRVWSGNKATLCVTGTAVLLPDHWYLIELHAVLSASSGSFELRVDGISDGTYSGPTTPSGSTFNFIECHSYPASGNRLSYYLDDIVICDTSGSVNNSWPGGLRIVLLRPIAKGDYTEWVPQTDQAILDNYWCVDGAPSLTPTEYIYTMFDAKTETYVMQNLPDEAYTVAALRMDAWALKNSGSPFGLQLAVVGPGLTLSLSDPQDLAVAYNLESWLMETIPGSTTSWGVTVVNTIQGGVRSYLT